MSPRKCSDAQDGFTLIETLVALAIMASALAAIGSVIATSVKHARAIDEYPALAGVAETLLAQLPPRALLKPGRQSGSVSGIRWRVDVAPLVVTEGDPGADRFRPLSVNLRLQRAGGGTFQVTTVKLVPRASP